MPDKTGIRLYKDLKRNEALRAIPVIMVTGFTAGQHPMIDFKKFIYERSIPGPYAFIEKPVDAGALLSAVSGALGGAAASAG
jgi:CheY-like chemotaxis protein